MEENMLKREDKIFKNLYNELGWEIENSLKRDDWKNTKDFISKGREWIINEIKTCLLYTSPSPRDGLLSRMPSSA